MQDSHLETNPKLHTPRIKLPTPTATKPCTCKILINPSKKTLSPPQKITLPPEKNPFFIPPHELNPLQKLAASALDIVENSVIMELEKKHGLTRIVDPAVQLEGNFAR
ncbi:unnamed protein product [Camellia sinensis]